MSYCFTRQSVPTYLSKLVRTALQALRRLRERVLRSRPSEGFSEALWREELRRISLL